MRILFWSEQFWPEINGVSLFGMHLMTGLMARGHEFAVITSRGRRSRKSREVVRGIPVYRFDFHPALVSRDLKRIAALVKQIHDCKKDFNPDAIHLNSSEPSLFFHEKTRLSAPPPCVITVHMSLSFRFGANTLFQRVLRRCDHVTAISRAVLEDARRFVTQPTPPMTMIPNALPQPEVPATPLDPAHPVILCLGRLSPEKGFDLALQAFPRVLQRHGHARLVITGEGPENENLKAITKQLKIAHAVRFTGPVPLDETPEAINRSFLVLVPSRCRESFGMVALQAAQMGRPVIAARTGGLAEVVLDGETGWLVEKENPTGLARRINQMLDYPATAVEMGARARERSRKEFDFHQWISDYEKVFMNSGKKRRQ